MVNVLSSVEELSIAKIAVFTAVAVALTMIPAFSVIGLQGLSITLGAIAPVLLGVVLRPREALASAILAGIISTIIPPPGVFGPLSPLPLIAGTLATILVYHYGVKGKALYASLHLILIALFITLSLPEIIVEYPYYPWFHIVGLITALILALTNKHKLVLVSSSIAGILVDHMTGSVIAQVYFPLIAGFKIPANIWASVTWIYPIERTILIVIASMLLIILDRIGVLRPWTTTR